MSKKEDETIKTIKHELIPEVKKDIKAMEKRVVNQVTNKIEEVKKIANKNKEYSKSILNKLNEDYKDNPPLEYPGDYKCLKGLQTYYNLNDEEVTKTNKLHKAIIKDYVNGKIVETIIKILTGFLHKKNLNSQSIFNTDTARNNYAAKHKDIWRPDKEGLYLNDRVIKPFCFIIRTLMKNYLQYKSDRSNHNRYETIHRYDSTEDEDTDIFLDKDHPGKIFVDKDDSSDKEKRFLDECQEVCDIHKLIKYIDTEKLYNEIIAKLSPILNYNIRIKNLD